ncbi:MAG TPA: STAS/SEC14 domain-containing protein [Bacteroidia bacterium]|nr:STAS/SEC14 domain-containing protein [Bacteroidia bacterium]
MIETRVFTTSLNKEQGYLLTHVKPGSEIGVNDARENTEAVISLSGGRNFPIVVDLRKIKSISKEARDHFSMRGRKPHVTAIAMVVSSPLSRIIGNFFLGLNKPTVPTRMFSSEADGIKWLSKEGLLD